MKKIIISAIALTMGMMAMATETTYVQIKLSGENGGASSIYLSADDAYTSAFESGADVEKMMSQANSKSLLFYGFVGTTPCQNIVTNDLTGLEIGLTTNQLDQNYTLTFSNFSGNEFSLYDRVANQYITVNASTPAYAFSVEASQVGRVAINDRFVIEAAPAGPGICFNYEKLQITGYAGAQLEVLNYADKASVFTETVAGDNVEIDLEAKGLTANTQYFVKLTPAGATAALEYVIKFKPAVTTL